MEEPCTTKDIKHFKIVAEKQERDKDKRNRQGSAKRFQQEQEYCTQHCKVIHQDTQNFNILPLCVSYNRYFFKNSTM